MRRADNPSRARPPIVMCLYVIWKLQRWGAVGPLGLSNRKKIIIIITIITGGTALKVSWQFPLFVLVSLGLLQGKASGSEDGIMLGSAVLGVYCGANEVWLLGLVGI